MKLFFKVLQFIKPYWRLIIITVLLTLCDVFFNNVSLWVSVNLIQELFSPQPISVAAPADSTAGGLRPMTPPQPENPSITKMLPLPDMKDVGIYQKANLFIKKLIIQENRYKTLKVVCILIFLSFLFKNVADYYRRLIISYIQTKIIIGIRNALQHAILRLPVPSFFKHDSGQLTSIMFNDVSYVQQILDSSLGNFLIIPIQLSLNVVILFLISWKLTLFTMVIVPISGFFIVKIGQSIRRKSRLVYRRIAEVVSAFQEMVNSIRIVKAFTNETYEEDKFRKTNDQFFKVLFRSHKLQLATSPINETLGILILSILLWYGGNMIYSGTGLASEDFIRFLVFLFALFKPLKELSGLNNVVQTGLAAAERIFMVIDAEKENYDDPLAKPMPMFRQSILFENVTFRYPSSDHEVLKNVQLEIRKGQTVALVGPSGSGKTTLVNLIPRFFEPESGRVLIDGLDIRQIRLVELRKQIGIVTQESILFNDTVRMNIGYGLENPTDDAVISAAKTANAWEFIEKMENGLDTVIGERGIKVSGGQKQRLAIARAILKNPPVLILDEATSSLDTESEKLVQDAIDTLMKHRTVLVIAHRLSTVIHADQIAVMQHGVLLDAGSHASLLKSCALYRKLYEIQFRDESGNSD